MTQSSEQEWSRKKYGSNIRDIYVVTANNEYLQSKCGLFSKPFKKKTFQVFLQTEQHWNQRFPAKKKDEKNLQQDNPP